MPTTNGGQSRSARTRQRQEKCTRKRRRLRNGLDGGDRRDVKAYIGIKTGSFPLIIGGPADRPGPLFVLSPVGGVLVKLVPGRGVQTVLDRDPAAASVCAAHSLVRLHRWPKRPPYCKSDNRPFDQRERTLAPDPGPKPSAPRGDRRAHGRGAVCDIGAASGGEVPPPQPPSRVITAG